MNKLLADTLEHSTPNFNSDIANGLACIEFSRAEEYIDLITKAAMASAPDKLEYLGYRRLSPSEEFKSLFNTAGNMEYDLSQSNIYKIALMFKYNGVNLPPNYLYLPYVEDGGILKLSGARYNITPIMTDTVISPGLDEVFAKLYRDKLSFKRLSRNIIINGEVRESHIIHAVIYRTLSKISGATLTSVVTPSAAYLLCKHGLVNTFKKYGNSPVILLKSGEDVSKYTGTHNIYESCKQKPKGVKEQIYKGHDVKILVPKYNSNSFTNMTVAAMMYIFDVFYENADEMVDIINGGSVSREKEYWKIFLGRLIFKNANSTDQIVKDMNEHFVSLSSYINKLIVNKLAEINIKIVDFYDLIAVIVTNYNDFLIKSKENKNSVYDRYLETLYYVFYEFIHKIHRAINDLSRRSGQKELTTLEAIKIIGSRIKPKLIYSINSRGVNLALNGVEYSGDNKYFKITSTMDLQERGTGVNKSKQNKLPHNIKSISGTDVYIGSVLFLTKPMPSPLGKINPFQSINVDTGRFTPPKEIKGLLDALDRQLQGKNIDNTKIQDIIENNEKELYSDGELSSND